MAPLTRRVTKHTPFVSLNGYGELDTQGLKTNCLANYAISDEKSPLGDLAVFFRIAINSTEDRVVEYKVSQLET